jgi:hypothetical protein
MYCALLAAHRAQYIAPARFDLASTFVSTAVRSSPILGTFEGVKHSEVRSQTERPFTPDF